jgi:hypothetical protein
MAWYLNPALTNFRKAVNARWPGRDKTSDGTIGDLAHQQTNSDHNPDPDGSVDAWDMDVDGVDVERLKAVFEAHESAGYWIHNGQVASRDKGWRRRTYTGPNPHDKHVHWNTRSSHETSNAPWDVTEHIEEEEDVARLTFFKADGKLWRSNGVTIRQISSATYEQIKDRGDNFPDDNGVPPSTDLVLDPLRGGWTWEDIKAAYGEDEALLVGGAVPGPTADEIRAIVDDELDQAFTAAADE